METNLMNFSDFLRTLRKTNASLGYFTDFNKCGENLKAVSIKLHTLDFLLGSKDLKTDIFTLFKQSKECFDTLNLLIAVRDKNTDVVATSGELTKLKAYFESPDKIYEFCKETGLDKIFMDAKIKNLHDYVFGVEVGLDTNTRKNRGGVNFSRTISEYFKGENIGFQTEVSSKKFALNLGSDQKIFDFVITAGGITYLIEANFYSTGGSKLNEVARSYIEIAQKISLCGGYKFVWITDGQGWCAAKNKLEEAYKSVKIYNLSTLHYFVKELKNV